MTNHVSAFPISSKLKDRLLKNGFSVLDDFFGYNVQDLANECQVRQIFKEC